MAKAELYVKNGNSWINYNLINAYPVGSIYCSASSTSPATLFGGSWAEITGAVLRGNQQSGVYSDSDSHVLSYNEMPKHGHYPPTGYFVCETNNGSMRNISPMTRANSKGDSSWGGHLGEDSKGTPLPTSPAGDGQAHTNKQRSYNVYMWRRTA